MKSRLLVFGCFAHNPRSGLTRVFSHVRYGQTNNFAHMRMLAMYLEVAVDLHDLSRGWRRRLAFKGENHIAFRAFPYERHMRCFGKTSGNQRWHNSQFPTERGCYAIPVDFKWHHYRNAPMLGLRELRGYEWCR